MANNEIQTSVERAPISETALTKKLLDFYSFILCVLCATWLIKTFIERKYPKQYDTAKADKKDAVSE
ncbi:hypothetical protein [Fibrobacter sp.]|uniref:hypothetical protein n=1 Tax=Fibrobacter sp. TaxID=35828 RepID=UPI00388DE0FA